MRRVPSLRLKILAALAAACFALPAAAFVVILKDGQQITTDGAYQRDGDMVILTLPNGTKASYPASDIDFEKTDALNEGQNFSNARLIEGNQSTRLQEDTVFEDDRKSLAELVSERSTDGGGLAMPEQSRREEKPAAVAAQSELPLTEAGFVDLMKLRRDPYSNEEIAGEITRYMRSQGVQDVRVYRGTTDDSPLVEVVATSEASVFKAVRDSANGLVQARGKYPSLTGFDLLLVTENRVLAGQFTLTPELANELVTGRIEPPTFFLRYVEF